jgi:hypothetical protein
MEEHLIFLHVPKAAGNSLKQVIRRKYCVLAGLEHFPTNLAETPSARNEVVAYGSCTEEHLERARENLANHFAVTGLLERFDETLLVLPRRFGWKHPFYSRANVTEKREPVGAVSREAKRAIEKYSRLDQQLYLLAADLLNERIAELRRNHFDLKRRCFTATNRPMAAAHGMLDRARSKFRRVSEEEASARCFRDALLAPGHDRAQWDRPPGNPASGRRCGVPTPLEAPESARLLLLLFSRAIHENGERVRQRPDRISTC